MNKIKGFINKNWLFIFCFLVIILQFSQIIYFKRAQLIQNYDATYWKDRFEHSQYVLPLSQRMVGDDGLYSYASYRLLKGESIENTTTFKPPVGLYLISSSILLFKNPIVIELILGFGVIICFYFFSLELLKDKKLALVTTTLFSLEPFIFSNFYIALLDLPQLFFLLLHLIFLLYTLRNNKFNFLFAIISGLALGLFTETKPPLLLPIIIALESIYLYKQKSLKQIFPIITGFLIGIVTPYFRYFQSGHNLIDYLKLHKYMASIYYSGHNQLFPLSIWQSLFIGYFPDVVSGQLIKISNWWPLLPVISIIGFIQTAKVLIQKKHPLFLKGLAIFFLAVLVIYTLVPSYTRYLILVVPFLYIFAADLLKKYVNKLPLILVFICFAIFGLFFSSTLLKPSTSDVLNGFKYNFSHQYFQDIYQENLSTSSKSFYSRQQFRIISQKAFVDARIVDVDFKQLNSSSEKNAQITYQVTYLTKDLGNFSENKTINLIQEYGQWKIVWNWNLLLDSFIPRDKLYITTQTGKRGTIYSNDGKVFAQDTNSILVSVNPGKIDTKREMEMLILLSSISAQEKIHLQNSYLENPLPNTYIDIATSFMTLSNEQHAKLKSYPGVKLSSYTSRLYNQILKTLPIENTSYNECCTRIYSSSNYHGIDGVEKKYDKDLSGYNGGALILSDEKGNIIKTLINRQPKNGKDINIP